MKITFDIETRPCDDAALIIDISQQAKAEATEAAEAVKAPSNYKDEAKIIEYISTKRAEIYAGALDAVAQKVARTSLDGAYGRICCICWAIDDQPATGEIGDNEAELIRLFFEACEDAATPMHYDKSVTTLTVVGHNVSGFDMRFLWQRAVVHGIKRPSCIPWNAKPWDACIKDTMLMWNPDRDKRISLDKLCKVLGVPTSKGDLDGSKIAQAWADGRRNEIADYCMADVVATRECYRRMTA